MISYKINPSPDQWPELLRRPLFNAEQLEETVQKILTDVRVNGDAALRSYTQKFDNADVENFLVPKSEINAAVNTLSPQLKRAIVQARSNIDKFHFAQLRQEPKIEIVPGVTCWRKQIPIEKVGLYIPGGSAPLFSTLLMLAIPATIAGCREIIVCTPPNSSGKIDDAILYVAYICGIEKIYKCGGVQAIAAMAYGTETIPAVYKIFGPGNQYVTTAKQLVTKNDIAIDMPAGPSEVAVYADETSVHTFVAADLLSQAEHGEDSQVVLVTNSEAVMKKIIEELESQLSSVKRSIQAKAAISKSRFFVIEEVSNAFDLLNDYAPEHLIIASANASALAKKVINAGSVFLGNYTPEAAGDYASGTNHTLPTNGYAKTYSGVSVDSFMKLVSFQEISQAGLKELGPVIKAMAEAEGLYAHSDAVKIRNNTESKSPEVL